MHIFYCADGKFGEVMGVFLAKKHSPDVVHKGTGCVRCYVDVWPESAKHTRRPTPDTGDLLCASLVLVSVSALDYVVFWQGTGRSGVSGAPRPVCELIANLPAYETGVLSIEWPHAFADLSTHVAGVHQTCPVPTWPFPVL